MNRSETLVILYLIANIMVVDLGYFSRYLNDLDALCAPVCGRAPPNIPLGNAKTLADCAAYLRNNYKKHCRVPGCRVVFCRFRTQQLRMTLCGLVPARKTGKENVENNLATALQKFREVLFVALSVNLLAVAVRLFCAILAVPPF